MSITTLLIIILIIALVAGLPSWNWSRTWGYGPSGIVGLILVVLLILFLTGRL